jgi:hypothetical protein
MLKVKILIAVCMVILFVVVAFFPNAAEVAFHGASKLDRSCSLSNNAVVLTADGGAPQPPIPPSQKSRIASQEV